MDPFIGSVALVIKLTFKIIEGVIRALVEVTILLATYIVFLTISLVIGGIFLRYGICKDRRICPPESSLGKFAIAASFGLVVCAVFVWLKKSFA